MANSSHVPPMLPMHRAEDSLIGFARQVLRIMAADGVHGDGRLDDITSAAERQNVADRVEHTHDDDPWLSLRAIDGGKR